MPACNVQVSTSFVGDQARGCLQRARQHQRQRQHADNVKVHVNVNINAVQVSDVSLVAVFKTIRQSTPSPSLLISSRSICRQCLTPSRNQITACQYLSPGKLFLFEVCIFFTKKTSQVASSYNDGLFLRSTDTVWRRTGHSYSRQ